MSTEIICSIPSESTMSVLKPVLPSLIVDDGDDDSSCGNHSEEGGLNFSDSDPKDSGIDCGPPDQNSEMPDEDTSASILKMVEFYLSDSNILKDPFLLKHVRRNKEGYVSIKLLASFRKVRSLCRNWKAVAHSVQKSKLLALNSDGTKVRRLNPLPDHDETVTSRSVIIHGFNNDKVSVDNISELFAHCGDITLVRILRPGGSIPSEVKRFLSKNPELQSKFCALVEFEEHASAKKALETELSEGIKVLPVLIKERNNPSSPKKENIPISASTTTNQPQSPQKESPKKKKKNRKGSNTERKDNIKSLIADDQKRSRRSSSGSMSSQSSGYLSSSPSSGSYFDSRYPRRHSFNPSIYNDPNSSFASLGSRYSNGSRDRLQRTVTEGSSTLSPWRRRREQQLMQSDSNLAASTNSGSASSLLLSLPVKTIRLPKGPDGTVGFLPRPRSRLPSTAE